ncbi:metallopeptidase family protein [Propionibacteriaceae bacterium G1746]|uniref:metallopeptidase family protein n=1 Tax=Aestuariimicrobium sp. G57 TaxID=3418485 RepID=UPI003C139F16
MVKRRDRHARGLRGPLAQPSAWGPARRTPGAVTRGEAFLDAVSEAISRVQQSCPEALVGIDIGVEDVPASQSTGGGVPLAAATEATAGFPARIVVYRRPLEHRSATRRGLRILVHRTLVEQLAALTGRSVTEIDPLADDDD